MLLRISEIKEGTASFAAFIIATGLLIVIQELENCSLNSLSFRLAAWKSLEAWTRLHEDVNSSECYGSSSCDRCKTTGFQLRISKANLNARRSWLRSEISKTTTGRKMTALDPPTKNTKLNKTGTIAQYFPPGWELSETVSCWCMRHQWYHHQQ